MRHRFVMHAEFAKLGFRLRNPELLDACSAELLLGHTERIHALRALRGGDVDYVPLFLDFPNDVPDQDEYFVRRVLGYLSNVVDPSGKMLTDATDIPVWLFELRQFGANPITQMQEPSLFERARNMLRTRKADESVEWMDLHLGYEDQVRKELQQWLFATLCAKSSIKEELHADLGLLLSELGIEGLQLDQIAMKENAALVMRMLWETQQIESLQALARSATDVLRLMAALTDSDVSLARPIRFPRLTRGQRRTVLRLLERAGDIREDLHRYRGLWLALGKSIHVGEYRRTFPSVVQSFDALRNGEIESFDAVTERLMGLDRADAVLEHLATRPGVFGRKIHEVLRRFDGERSTVLAAFDGVAQKMTVKHLLVLRSYFATINARERRTVINKRGKIKVLPNNANNALGRQSLEALDEHLHAALLRKLSAHDDWSDKRVWVDPALKDYTVPLQQRAASDGLITVGRGSRLPVDFSKVLRLFVYWKQASSRTDLDLSVIQFDAGFKYAGHVSYTNLAAGGIVHSGDLQSAPHGAAEFVDITLDRVDRNVRYLAVQVYRYAGDTFAEMDCHAGWMCRDRVDGSYASFDIKTVANKFDLNGTGGYCVPLVVDLHERCIIATDLFMGTKAFHNNVEGSHGAVAAACREIADFVHTRPTMLQLAQLHREARGAVPGDRDAADVRFGLQGCDYNALDVERVLSELL